MPESEFGYDNIGLSEEHTEDPVYERPQYQVYENSEKLHGNQREHSCLEKAAMKNFERKNIAGEHEEELITAKEAGLASIDDGYIKPIEQPSGKMEISDSSYMSMIGDQERNKERNKIEVKGTPDDLAYVDVINKDYSSLVRSPLQNYEDETQCYTSLIKRANEGADKLEHTQINNLN